VKPWEGAEVGIVRQIVAMIGYDAAESLLRAAVTDWDGIYFDDDAVRWPAYPSLFFIRRHLEALVNWCMREHGLEVESETPDEVAEHVGDVLVSARDLDSSEDAWQTAVAAEHGGFVAPWTVRDREKVRRMAAELITEFGDDSLPGEVLVRCAKDWERFCEHLRRSGVRRVPRRPDVRMVVEHFDVAVEKMIAQSMEAMT
jgi:hypothetical protein